MRTDVTAVVVTHDSGAQLPGLVADLARVRGDLDVRVVVVDNASTDDTVAVARGLAERTDGLEVTVLEAPGNLGYAGGLNHALDHVGPTRAVLVLNADLRMEPGSLTALWRRLWQDDCGAVAPRLLEPDGAVARSLRFEPRPLRAIGDALLGDRVPGRPTWSTETDLDTESYGHAHPIEWATGACLLVRSEVLEAVGRWDERYFLYSEEVDYLRRVREAGWAVWFEPAASATHVGGGSGRSRELDALLEVNRVRYVEATADRTAARAVRAAALAGCLLRAPRSPAHRTSAAYLLSRRRWARLPAARLTWTPPHPPTLPLGSVVVPAHQEEAVIGRTLAPLAGLVEDGQIELLVAVNGSTDQTVQRALEVEGAVVLDLATPSKTAALNSADHVATAWPRLYLDADIEITARAVHDVLTRLAQGDVPAARPPFVYDTTGASWPVRVFYRTRQRVGSLQSHLWGAGAYALSEAGHARLGAFPELTADDLAVDAAFGPTERVVVDTDPVVVRTPRDLAGLMAVLRRTYRGNAELSAVSAYSPATGRTLRDLLGTVRGPRTAADAAVYAALVLAGRRRAARAGARWDRDESSRAPAAA